MFFEGQFISICLRCIFPGWTKIHNSIPAVSPFLSFIPNVYLQRIEPRDYDTSNGRLLPRLHLHSPPNVNSHVQNSSPLQPQSRCISHRRLGCRLLGHQRQRHRIRQRSTSNSRKTFFYRSLRLGHNRTIQRRHGREFRTARYRSRSCAILQDQECAVMGSITGFTDCAVDLCRVWNHNDFGGASYVGGNVLESV